MKKKKTKLPQYGFGGSIKDPLNDYLMLQYNRGITPNVIEDPNTAITRNNIALAKADEKANNNAWTQGLDIFGNLAMQVGTSMMSQGIAKGQGVTKGGFNWGSLLQKGVGAMSAAGASADIFATGGIPMGNVPVNVEGQEIIETPNGQIQEVQGSSHEQGGIDMVVPGGTEIFSKRLKGPDGKNMAKRKKERELQIQKLEKLLKKNPSDKLLKKTLEKTKADYEFLEQQDLAKMQMAHQIVQQQQQQFATGGITGGWEGYPYPYNEEQLNPMSVYENTNPWNLPIGDVENNGDVTVKAKRRSLQGLPQVLDTSFIGTPTVNDVKPISNEPNFTQEYLNKSDVKKYKSDFNMDSIFGNMTGGDLLGLVGQLHSTYDPMKNTLANRAGDTPNINAFKDYGKDALHKMDQSKQYVNQVRDENLKDLELARTGQISRNRNSARGLNTQRALDLTVDANINDTKSKIFSQFAQAMQQIYGQEATLENDQDAKVMQGEYMRDLADRQDRDNYFSQMAQDIATKGTGLQHIGKNVNEIKTRNVTGKLMNQLYNNFGVNSMTGEVKAKATEELNAAPNFYKDAHADTLQKVLNKELVRNGDKLYDTEGNELDKKTLKVINAKKKEEISKETPKINEDALQQVMDFFNRKVSYTDKLGTHYKGK